MSPDSVVSLIQSTLKLSQQVLVIVAQGFKIFNRKSKQQSKPKEEGK